MEGSDTADFSKQMHGSPTPGHQARRDAGDFGKGPVRESRLPGL